MRTSANETTGDAFLVGCFLYSWTCDFLDGFDIHDPWFIYSPQLILSHFLYLRHHILWLFSIFFFIDSGTLHALYIVIITRSIRHSFHS
jgi:hypothetical protein